MFHELTRPLTDSRGMGFHPVPIFGGNLIRNENFIIAVSLGRIPVGGWILE
jgi:hypothetical protein